MFDGFFTDISNFFGSVSDFLFTDSGIGNLINPLIGAGLALFTGSGGSGGGGRSLVTQPPKVPDFDRLPTTGQPGSPSGPRQPTAANSARIQAEWLERMRTFAIGESVVSRSFPRG